MHLHRRPPARHEWAGFSYPTDPAGRSAAGGNDHRVWRYPHVGARDEAGCGGLSSQTIPRSGHARRRDERDRRRRTVDADVSQMRQRFGTLSPREQQVMLLVTAGKMNKQVAGDLGISEITVKIHRGAAMRKMGARTLADLVRMAEVVKPEQR